ncbi:hypothetical protein M218_25870 [Burkholderia pseudomallei MSHR338]|nr:hypothetical protein M218_25870 [Burkholderia pseudomallei MSHR338]
MATRSARAHRIRRAHERARAGTIARARLAAAPRAQRGAVCPAADFATRASPRGPGSFA